MADISRIKRRLEETIANVAALEGARTRAAATAAKQAAPPAYLAFTDDAQRELTPVERVKVANVSRAAFPFSQRIKATAEPAVNPTKHTIVIRNPASVEQLRADVARALAGLHGHVQINPILVTAKDAGEEDRVIQTARAAGSKALFPEGFVLRARDHGADVARILERVDPEYIREHCWTDHRLPQGDRTGAEDVGTATVPIGLLALEIVVNRRTPAVSAHDADVALCLKRKTSAIKTFTGDRAKPHLCLWMCVAAVLDPSLGGDVEKLSKPARRLYAEFYGRPYDERNAFETRVEFLDDIARMHGLNLHVWQVDKVHVDRVDVSALYTVEGRPGADFRDIVVQNGHAMLALDLDAITRDFVCTECGAPLGSKRNLEEHLARCLRPPQVGLPTATTVYGRDKLSSLLKLGYKMGIRLNADMGTLLPPGTAWEHPWAPVDHSFPWAVVFSAEAFRREDGTHSVACVAAVPVGGLQLPPFYIDAVEARDTPTLIARFLDYINEAADRVREAVDAKWVEPLAAIRARVRAYYERAAVEKMPDAARRDSWIAGKVANAMRRATEDLYRLPVLAFGAARYDLPLLISDGLLPGILAAERRRLEELHGADAPKERRNPVRRMLGSHASGFKSIAFERFELLDARAYTPGMSLDDFCASASAVTGGWVFPHDAMTGPEFLLATADIVELPGFDRHVAAARAACAAAAAGAPRAGDTLRDGTHWRRYLLRDYAMRDANGLARAWDAYARAIFDRHGVVATKDAVGLPGVARHTMAQLALGRALDGCNPYDFGAASGVPVPARTALEARARDYAAQDLRKFGRQPPMSADAIAAQWELQRGRCMYCRREMLGGEWSADRLDCDLPHCAGPFVMAHPACNAARGYRSAYLFWRERALWRARDHVVCVLGRDSDDVRNDFGLACRQLGMIGAFAGTYYRALRVGDPHPPIATWRDGRWVQEPCPISTRVQAIAGYDFVAMYSSCFYEPFPCGAGAVRRCRPEETPAVLAEIVAGEGRYVDLFVADVRIPPERRTEFSQWAPLLVRGRATFDQLSPLQQDYERQRYPGRTDWQQWGDTKLFPAMEARGALLNDAYLRFLHSIGAEVSNVTLHARFNAATCLADLPDTFARQRAAAKADGNRPLELASKSIPNATWGSLGLDPAKTATASRVALNHGDYYRAVNRPRQKLVDVDVYDGEHPVWLLQQTTPDRLERAPVHAAAHMLLLARLKMQRWIYGFLTRYVPRHRVQIASSDTDSLVLGLCHELDIQERAASEDLATYVPADQLDAFLREVYAVVPGSMTHDALCDRHGLPRGTSVEQLPPIERRVYDVARGAWQLHRVPHTPCTHADKRLVWTEHDGTAWRPLLLENRYDCGAMNLEFAGQAVYAPNPKVCKKVGWTGEAKLTHAGSAAGTVPEAAYERVLEYGAPEVVDHMYVRRDNSKRLRTEVTTRIAMRANYAKGLLLDPLQVAPFDQVQQSV